MKADIDRQRQLSAAESIELGVSLTQALDKLHEHGLTHRDIKPSNIIFIDGVPKLADIGLVAATGQSRLSEPKVTFRRKDPARRRQMFSVSVRCSTRSAREKTALIFRSWIRG